LEGEVGQRSLTHKEESGIYALRALSENLSNSSPIYFLVASDHLVGNKDLLLRKVDGDGILTGYIEHIFEVRELYLGTANKDNKIETSHPLFYALLTKNEGVFSAMIAGMSPEEVEAMFDTEIFIQHNQPDKIEVATNFIFGINSFGISKLFIEIISQNPERLRKLLSDRDASGRNVLGVAAFNGQDEVVKAILGSAALQNPELLRELLVNADDHGFNILQIAALNGRAETVKAILGSAHPDLLRELVTNRDASGLNMLGVAARNNRSETVREILESVSLKNTALLEELLMSKDNVNLNTLGVSAFNGHTETVREILESHALQDVALLREALVNNGLAGCSPHEIMFCDGSGALEVAARNGHAETVKEILESKVLDSNPELLIELLFRSQLETSSVEVAGIFLEKGCVIKSCDDVAGVVKICEEAQQNAKNLIDSINKGTLPELIRTLEPEQIKQARNISIDTGIFCVPKPYTPLQLAEKLGNIDFISMLTEPRSEQDQPNPTTTNSLAAALGVGEMGRGL
jgi:ankyrin repeat protein